MILLWVVFYWYFFIYSLITVQFHANVDNYNIHFDSTQKSYEQVCEEEICIMPDISPFEYEVIITKDTYKTLTYTYKPTQDSAVQDIVLEKNYELQPVNLLSQDDAVSILENEEQEISIADKIELLKEKQSIYYKIITDNNSYIFKEKWNNLELYKNNTFLWNFNFAKKSEIQLKEIIWNPNYLFLELWENKYLFSISSGTSNKIIFEVPILYIKSGESNGKFIFVTQKGSFEYNSYTDIFTYNSFFSDYVIFQKNTYVWIINADDDNKQSKFNLTQNTKQTILQYNPETKEQIILLETSKDIVKIFKKDWEIYLEDSDKNYFTLSHLLEK